ncbi:MAG: hypothetical protein R2941_20990 [Desulfobacterales bacterium]
MDGYELYMTWTPDILDSWTKLSRLQIYRASFGTGSVIRCKSDQIFVLFQRGGMVRMNTVVSDTFSIKTPEGAERRRLPDTPDTGYRADNVL